MKTNANMSMADLFGEPISVYTREQAIEDGELVDVTEWASPSQMSGGFTCPVVLTRHLWNVVDVDALPEGKRPFAQDTRGRAHDVLWMGGLAARSRKAKAMAEAGDGSVDVLYELLLSHGRKKKATLRLSFNTAEGFTIGFPEDF